MTAHLRARRYVTNALYKFYCSEQISIEEALRNRETVYQALVSGIPDLLIRMNLDGVYLDFLPGSTVKLYAPKSSHVGANVYIAIAARGAFIRYEVDVQGVGVLW